MSYSNKKKEYKKFSNKNVMSFEFNSDIQNDIGVIKSYTSRISRINDDEPYSIESSEKVQEIVQEGKLKIQEIQKKLKNYRNITENVPQHEKVRVKLMLQRLSNSYLEAVNNFQKASKNYINKTIMNDLSTKNYNVEENMEYDSLNNFSRKSNSNYDTNIDKYNVNIYDYNFYENNYETSYSKYNNSTEFQSVDSTIEEKTYKKKKKYKSNIFTGDKKNEVNEYLLENNNYEQENNNYGQEKQFVSINTVDIENEILTQKNKEIKKLHKDIINIQELYKELFEQINIQGENIDNIDSQMVNTHDNIMMSGREIEIARNRYFSSLRCTIYLLFLILILVIIILVVFRII
ncbi:syntaxin, Qa-SNARE family [Plasmodium sp. gorilla clade G1]|nr:syntaxin, Qa-SNARE family [Plasmodium sp. gorilla clade G1]